MAHKHIRSKERVAKHGEVFTPDHIVKDMHELIPEDSWSDHTMIYLEPTCGNGQFVEAAVQKKMDSGLSEYDAVNTTFGMDIMADNIADCRVRVLRVVVKSMKARGISMGNKVSRSLTAPIMQVIVNNIFQVEDSLAYMKDGSWEAHPFVKRDPTGGSSVLGPTKWDALTKAAIELKEDYFKKYPKEG